jgi:hypothetical protein
VIVLAGDHAQFLKFCRDRKIRHDTAIHAKSPADIRGQEYVQVYKTGTWYLMDRETLAEIVDAIRAVDQVGIAEEEDYAL